MKCADGVVNGMTNPVGLSTLGNAADVMNKATTSESFSIVLRSVAKLAKALDLLSEVSLTSTCIENDSLLPSHQY